MAAVNRAVVSTVKTFGGAPAIPNLNPVAQLRRLVLSCLLWEDQFYVDGKSVADQIEEAALKVPPNVLAQLAIEARQKHGLRHVPLLLTAILARTGKHLLADTVVQVVQRADELAELLAVYWRNGKTPISKQLKRGLARAFAKFDEYALAKYDRAKAIRLRDVMFLVHPKPDGEKQADLWKRLANNELATPDTWEVALSAGANKKETFERLIKENKLGYLALLRNLRNMEQAGVDRALVRGALAKGSRLPILPFRYVAAARHAPVYEPELDKALQTEISLLPKLPGRTIVLVDVSGSMDYKLSAKSDLSRLDAAATLASVINAEELQVFTFSEGIVQVPPRRGMAGVDAVVKSQPHGGTYLAKAVGIINKLPHDRLIVITDEQATDARAVPDPVAKHAYMINVAAYKNGVGYRKWTHIDGFSEQVIKYIYELENSK